jgi:hypothetical protein
VGTAVTVKTLAAYLAAAFEAIDVSQPGDIVVIDSHGWVDVAFGREHDDVGGQSRVIAAVIDNAYRDVEEIRRMRFPVLCKGVVPNVGAIARDGEVTVAIQCAGVSSVARRHHGCRRQRRRRRAIADPSHRLCVRPESGVQALRLALEATEKAAIAL